MQKIFRILLLIQLAVLSLNGLAAGSLLIAVPDGSLVGLPQAWLEHAPFSSYFIPGCLLFLFMGVLPALAFTGIAFKRNWHWAQRINLLPARSSSNTLALYSGVGAIIWIAVQQMMTSYFMLQPIIVLLGVGIVVSGLVGEDKM